MSGPKSMKWHDQLWCFPLYFGTRDDRSGWEHHRTMMFGQEVTHRPVGKHMLKIASVFRCFQVSAITRLRCHLQRHPCDTKCTYCTLVHVGVSARVISPSQPETLILCRSFYDPPWLQPWCQRNQRSIFIWILSHWNIEWHLGLKSVVSAATSEPADNPTMGAEKLFCLCSLERNIITSNYIRQSFECWHFMANGIPRPSAGCNFSQNQFRLIIPPEAEKSARGQKIRLMPFWPNSPAGYF